MTHFTHHISRDETKVLRQTNIELMDRLKQLWECYKSLNPVFDPTATPSDTSTIIINPETQHNHITPFTDSKSNHCMSTSFSCHTHAEPPKDPNLDTNFHANTTNPANVTEVAAVSSYSLTESCNHKPNKYVIVNENEVEVIGNIFLITFLFSFFFLSLSNHLCREDISSLQTNLQTLSNKLITPSITSAPSSLLAQSNLLSSLNLTNNINNHNQEKLSKVDNLYDSIISTTVDNMSSLSHSLTNQISAIKDTYSLPTFTTQSSSAGQDTSQFLVKDPNVNEG